jgi:hypothetical protein
MQRGSDRVFWGVGLIGLGAAGLVSTLAIGPSLAEPASCDPRAVQWAPSTTPTGLPTVEFKQVEPGCRDATALVSYWRGEAVVYTTQMRLEPGASAVLDASVEDEGPVDHVSWTLLGRS